MSLICKLSHIPPNMHFSRKRKGSAGQPASFWNSYLAVAIRDRIMMICNEHINNVIII